MQERLPDMPERRPIQPLALSAVVMTRNEEHNIKACLESLQCCAEIVVVDNGSSDATCNIIEQQFPRIKLLRTEWKGYGGTRQLGVESATHDWILWLDADERMNEELASEIRAALSYAPSNAVLSIPRRNYFLGQHIRGCEWSPDRVVRVFNRISTRFDDKVVHEGLNTSGQREVVRLHNALDHYSYRSIRQFFQKTLHYALLAADERTRLGHSVSLWEILARPCWRFFRTYVLKHGFLDGAHGFVICLGGAFYVFARDSVRYFEAKTQSQ